MRIIRFTSAASCGILRPSQRAFGTYLCVYREEDDHTAPDRKSSGWMILSAMWLRRAVSPSRRVGQGRQILSFPSSCRPGQKVRRCEWSRSDALFVCALLYILLSVCRLYTFSPHITPLYSPLHVYRSLTASSYFFHIFPAPTPLLPSFLPAQVRRSPRLSPLHTPNGLALLSPAMFRPSSRYTYSCPRSAILTVALVPLYLQLPPPRPLSGLYAASESLSFERSFRLLYCFANGLPLPVDSDCIQCLMYEKLSCFR